ncbi:MAG: hypothetical protein GH151_09650 [Bacteroidetes bacterium]|nr:hypothetical protein [Bacteroidota bacterium]
MGIPMGPSGKGVPLGEPARKNEFPPACLNCRTAGRDDWSDGLSFRRGVPDRREGEVVEFFFQAEYNSALHFGPDFPLTPST